MLSNVSQDRKAITLGLMAVALWSTVATAFNLSLQFVSPLLLVTISSATSWVFFGVIVAMNVQFKALASASTRDISITLAI